MRRKLPEVDPVVLHDIAGMRAGKVIFIGLVILIVIIVFLLFFLPGIIRGGRYVSFNSPLTQVGIILDGKYLGSTEGTRYFVSSGEHSVTYIKNGETIKEDTLKIDHPVFLTLLIHYCEDIEVSFDQDMGIFSSAYDATLDEAVLYSAVTDYDEYYNYKPIFTYLAKDAAAMGISDVSEEFDVLEAFVTSQEMKRDLDNAIAILEENNITYRSRAFSSLYSQLDAILAGTETTNSNISNTAVMPDTDDNIWYTYPEAEFTIGKNGSLSIDDASSLPLPLTVPAFTVAGHMVTEYEYALFTEANPYWSKSNRDNLIADGVVDEYYLEGVYLTTATRSERPIRNISWYAAKAYAEYLSENSSQYNYRLITEAEFEVMASSTTGKAYSTSLITVDTDSSTPSSVMGGLWEFTESHFVPLMRVSGIYSRLTALDNADIIIKGGSYVNDPTSISAASTGVIAKNTTSEYAGIRIVRESK